MLTTWPPSGEPAFQVLTSAPLRLRDVPPTLVRIPFVVLRGCYPTFEDGWLPHVPLLALEVKAGPERTGDLNERVKEYEACGVQVVWILDPDFKTVVIRRSGVTVAGLNSEQTITGDPELPGFSAPVADFFR